MDPAEKHQVEIGYLLQFILLLLVVLLSLSLLLLSLLRLSRFSCCSGTFPREQVAPSNQRSLAVPNNAAFCKSSILLFTSNFFSHQSFNLFGVGHRAPITTGTTNYLSFPVLSTESFCPQAQ